MTNSPPSSSDPEQAFNRLHTGVQEWIWDQNWQQLRPTQIRAIEPVLAAEHDVIISAATACGKTEAAWLPVCSRIAFDREAENQRAGVKALYISPLKALINDQYDRLRELAQYVDTPVYRRHGDVGGSERTAIANHPDGLLLTTPESLEAMFVLDGSAIPGTFDGLRYIVIDELNSFIGTERGAQLQSLIHRIELAIRRRVVRIGLSATLADLGIAADFLRPNYGDRTILIDGNNEDRGELQMQLRGYLVSQLESQQESDIGTEDDSHFSDTNVIAIAEHLYANLRSSDNLVFANARTSVEIYSDLLRQFCRQRQTPEVFHPHHGSLSKELREDVERKLKAPDIDATAICTSTLEMGIDIGSTDSVAQIGPPGSVAALRQRFGRSGRRGKPAILRIYISENDPRDTDHLHDLLNISLVETLATVELMLVDRWYEPPNISSLHLSTLIQQLLSVIAQHGGATAAHLYRTLCGNGPFTHVTASMFTRLLRDLGQNDVIVQAGDGTLLPGRIGEKLVNHYTFYAAFQTTQEYRLIADGRPIGTLPIDFPLLINDFMIFAGRRWKIVDVDETARIVILTKAGGRKPPKMGGSRGRIADGIRLRMREIYERTDVPAYLNDTACNMLAQARQTYTRYELAASPLCRAGKGTQIVAFRGDLILDTLTVMFAARTITATNRHAILSLENTSVEQVRELLSDIRRGPPPDPIVLAAAIRAKQRDKHDAFLGDDLITAACAARDLDLPATLLAIDQILAPARQRSTSPEAG